MNMLSIVVNEARWVHSDLNIIAESQLLIFVPVYLLTTAQH